MDSQDNFARKGIRGEERIALVLSLLAADDRFSHGSFMWNRGKTTMWDSLYMFIRAVKVYLAPMVLRFPMG